MLCLKQKLLPLACNTITRAVPSALSTGLPPLFSHQSAAGKLRQANTEMPSRQSFILLHSFGICVQLYMDFGYVAAYTGASKCLLTNAPFKL